MSKDVIEKFPNDLVIDEYHVKKSSSYKQAHDTKTGTLEASIFKIIILIASNLSSENMTTEMSRK